MIDPGKFRHQITFQQYDGTVDQYGDVRDDVDANWDDFKTVWAEISPVSGKEFYAAEQSRSQVSHKVRIRYIAGLRPSMRIKFGSRKFKIISLINWNEKNEEYLIYCTELVS